MPLLQPGAPKMPWTQKPTSFSDFVFDADGEAPILIYRAADCPPVPDALSRGTDCYAIHQRCDESRSCPLEAQDLCLTSASWTSFDSQLPNYILVLPPSFMYALPGSWISALRYHNNTYFDWILATPEVVKRTLQEKEPFAAIWAYNKGPRQWCQHGGDEDWTAVVRKSAYLEPKDTYTVDGEEYENEDSDELHFKDYLDCCGTSHEDEEDFRVFTGAHA